MVWLFFPLCFHYMERYIPGDCKLYLVGLHCSALLFQRSFFLTPIAWNEKVQITFLRIKKPPSLFMNCL